ncbi:MAG: hypothetical protein J0I28_06730 [Caulobacterales bacterium]|nr:hypothetical protein [Caulobacterales bacterium]
MSKFNDEWVVQPHGELEKLDDGLFTVTGEIVMPLGRFPRRMTVVTLTNGRVAIWSPVPLAEPQMRQIEALGRIAFLIVPGMGHRLDIKPWKARYPDAKVVCPPGAKAAVEEVIPVDAVGSVLRDPDVHLETVPGVDEVEAYMRVMRGDRLTLVLNDIVANVRHPHGLGANIMARVLGFGVHHPETPKVGKKMFVKDAARLAGEMRTWADEPELTRIVVSHGDVIEEAPGGALRMAAAGLTA